jgi:hypothetical protein
LPLPERAQRSFLTPPVPRITSPASGLWARQSTSSARSSSPQIFSAEPANTCVSATVMGRVFAAIIYVNDAQASSATSYLWLPASTSPRAGLSTMTLGHLSVPVYD